MHKEKVFLVMQFPTGTGTDRDGEVVVDRSSELREEIFRQIEIEFASDSNRRRYERGNGSLGRVMGKLSDAQNCISHWADLAQRRIERLELRGQSEAPAESMTLLPRQFGH